MSDRQLTPELLLSAYASGIFPMAEGRNSRDIYWVDPRHRGIMPLDGFHMSRSLAKRLRQGDYRIALSTDLDAVLDGCADRDETWINGTIRDLTHALFAAGRAHTLEVWRDEKLIGGVYGITLSAAFFGESMFSRETDASKIALVALVYILKRNGGGFIDCQIESEHLNSLGARNVSRVDFENRLQHTIAMQTSPDNWTLPASTGELI